jgi:hypothetical protein
LFLFKRETKIHGVKKPRKRMPLFSKVKLIPPAHKSARDEGPRLIPFGEQAERHETSDYYVRLADELLSPNKKNLKKPTP